MPEAERPRRPALTCRRAAGIRALLKSIDPGRFDGRASPLFRAGEPGERGLARDAARYLEDLAAWKLATAEEDDHAALPSE